jgi:hypothetical protein
MRAASRVAAVPRGPPPRLNSGSTFGTAQNSVNATTDASTIVPSAQRVRRAA